MRHLAFHTTAASLAFLFLVSAAGFRAQGADLVTDVEHQPLSAQARRLVEALTAAGAPLPAADRTALTAAQNDPDAARAVAAIQTVLDKHCLVHVSINPESRVKVARGAAEAMLAQNGWRIFLVKVVNEAGVTAELRAASPNAESNHNSPWSQNDSDRVLRRRQRETLPQSERWMDLAMYTSQPMQRGLSGLKLEYRILQLYSNTAGRRDARLLFDVGQGTQDLGFRNEVDILFQCLPSREITLQVLDENALPAMAAFVVRDQAGRIHPSPAKRLAPDFAFHPQVYRANGETITLPDGEYTVEFSRGPESLTELRRVSVGPETRRLAFAVRRWIDPSKSGYWSGDHHIHAAGCAHYTNPSEGVLASDMIRHILGEDLKVGCNLTWGPCFDYQKQFFTGADDKTSVPPYILHYDIEVSGFGSHQSGHLCLLRLKEQIYPGGDSDKHWPTLGLNTLRWAKKQGAVVGPAHSGWGLEVNSSELPNYIVPPFSGIGANEYIMNVTHEVPGPDGRPVPAVDFISTVDTPYVWELNIWYHTLNCGFRTRISGETDFPCIYGDKVGLGRSYVKLDGPLDYHSWCEGIRQGRNYVGDGKTHLMAFTAQSATPGSSSVRMGDELKLAEPGLVRLRSDVAARLEETADESLRRRPYAEKPYWDIERARMEGTRRVPVEVIVNGRPVGRREIVADGSRQPVEFEVRVDHSSWIALRVLPSAHTNPIWVTVGDRPVRASRRSAEWCLQGVDQCWSQKERFIKPDELEQAKADYEHALRVYRRIIAESDVE